MHSISTRQDITILSLSSPINSASPCRESKLTIGQLNWHLVPLLCLAAVMNISQNVILITVQERLAKLRD